MLRTRTLRSISLLALLSCRGESSYRDLSTPLVMEDYLALPAEVTPANASLVVRRCLQEQRRSVSTPDELTGYAFRPEGFVQLRHVRTPERDEERGIRTYIDYASISSVQVEPYFDIPYLKDRFRVTLEGGFRRWEAHIRTFDPQPDLGGEPGSQALRSVILVLDDPLTAQRLFQALSLLSHPK